jgi:hypothetical protein
MVLLGLVGACTSAAPEALDDRTTAELLARAGAEACGSDCDLLTVYVRDQLFYADTLVGDEQAMPDETRTALTDRFDEVEFVDMEDADRLVDDEYVVDDGDGVLISVSPVDQLAEGVMGVDVGVTRSLDAYFGQTVQFMWDGETWALASSEDTGVPVVTSVS